MLAVIVALLLLQEPALDEARRLVERGELGEAIALLEREVERSPTAPLLAFLSQLQVATDAVPQATQTLARALEIAPEQWGWRTTLGALFFRLGRLDEAEEELTQVLRERPRAPIAHYYLASVMDARGDHSRAEESARLAVDEMPREPVAQSLAKLEFSPLVNAMYLLADVENDLGRDPEARLRRLLELEPTHPGARYLLARTLLEGGRREEGRKELEAFDRAKRAHEHLELALNFRSAGNLERGLAELRRALEAYPDHPRALYFLARELLSRGDDAEAATLLERLVAAEPEAAPLARSLRQPEER
jgi:predicted Zn-dependent protease